ncbi:MAG: hypothetical protein AB1758_19145, partial [Candidatus Eremiobacterota bacterium]
EPDPTLSLDEFLELYSTNQVSAEEVAALEEVMPDPDRVVTAEELARLTQLETDLQGFAEQYLWKDGAPEPDELEALQQAGQQLVLSVADQPDWWLDLAWAVRCSEELGRYWNLFLTEWDKRRKEIARLEKLVDEAEPELAPGMSDEEQLSVCHEILQHLEQGNALNWMMINTVKRRWKKFIEGARVQGSRPATPDAFRALEAGLQLERLRATHEQRWVEEQEKRGWGRRFDEPPVEEIKKALRWYGERFTIFENAARATGLRWEAWMGQTKSAGLGSELKTLARAIQANLEQLLERRRVHLQTRWLQNQVQAAEAYLRDREGYEPGSRQSLWSGLLAALTSKNVERYAELMAQLHSVRHNTDLIQRRRELLNLLEEAAPAWADAVRHRHPPHNEVRPPGDPLAAWRWTFRNQHLAGRPDLEPLQHQIVELSRQRDEVARKVVGHRSRAATLRKREPLVQLLSVPEALERYTPGRDRFDLVVIEHAQRLDIRALALLALGERVLVLGDSQSLEPPPAPAAVRQLAARLIPSLGYDGTQSLLALMDGPDSVRLTGTVRARSELQDLWGWLSGAGPQEPGRPSGSPSPLVLHRCQDPERETEETVALAAALLGDADLAHVRVAVVCLAGEVCAARVARMLAEKVSPRDCERVDCGSPSQLLGGEYEVAVVALGDTPAARPLPLRRGRAYLRRVCAALALARQQVYLVHSLDPQRDLLPGDLRRQILSGLPTRRDDSEPDSFRGQVYRYLKDHGYRVRLSGESAVAVEGRCLLVCQGEPPTSPWPADLQRDAWQEQLGWSYLRVRLSEYSLDFTACLERLRQRLSALKVEPGTRPDALADRVRRQAARFLTQWGPLAPGPSPLPKLPLFDLSCFPSRWHALAEGLLAMDLAVEPGEPDRFVAEVSAKGRSLRLLDRSARDIANHEDAARAAGVETLRIDYREPGVALAEVSTYFGGPPRPTLMPSRALKPEPEPESWPEVERPEWPSAAWTPTSAGWPEPAPGWPESEAPRAGKLPRAEAEPPTWPGESRGPREFGRPAGPAETKAKPAPASKQPAGRPGPISQGWPESTEAVKAPKVAASWPESPESGEAEHRGPRQSSNWPESVEGKRPWPELADTERSAPRVSPGWPESAEQPPSEEPPWPDATEEGQEPPATESAEHEQGQERLVSRGWPESASEERPWPEASPPSPGWPESAEQPASEERPWPEASPPSPGWPESAEQPASEERPWPDTDSGWPEAQESPARKSSRGSSGRPESSQQPTRKGHPWPEPASVALPKVSPGWPESVEGPPSEGRPSGWPESVEEPPSEGRPSGWPESVEEPPSEGRPSGWPES